MEAKCHFGLLVSPQLLLGPSLCSPWSPALPCLPVVFRSYFSARGSQDVVYNHCRSSGVVGLQCPGDPHLELTRRYCLSLEGLRLGVLWGWVVEDLTAGCNEDRVRLMFSSGHIHNMLEMTLWNQHPGEAGRWMKTPDLPKKHQSILPSGHPYPWWERFYFPCILSLLLKNNRCYLVGLRRQLGGTKILGNTWFVPVTLADCFSLPTRCYRLCAPRVLCV